jgi:hypothetical protein
MTRPRWHAPLHHQLHCDNHTLVVGAMAALFLEAALMALSAYAIATRSHARQVLLEVSDGSTIGYRGE